MKNHTDFELVRRILEKCERGEPLNADEMKYGDIIQSLKSKSRKNVNMDADFHDDLKRELLETYDELYPESQKGYFVFPKIPKLFFWFAVSFCLMVAVGFGVFNILGTGMEKSSGWAIMASPGNNSSYSSKDISGISAAPSEILEKSEIFRGASDSASLPSPVVSTKKSNSASLWVTVNFSNSDQMSNSLKWVAKSDDGVSIRILVEIALVLIVSGIGLAIFLKRRKK